MTEKELIELRRLRDTPISKVAQIAIQRGRTIHRLERKLSKRNRLSAKQHRYIREKVDTSAAPVV